MARVNDATQRKPQSSPPFRLATGLVIALVLFALGLMHLHLWLSHDEERGLIIHGTEQRAAQLVSAVADRMNVLVRSTDFMLQELRTDYSAGEATFRELAGSLLSSFPDRSLQDYAITDAEGNVLFTSAAMTGPVNLGDRDYFISHRDGSDRLIISKPLGRSHVQGLGGPVLATDAACRPFRWRGRGHDVATVHVERPRDARTGAEGLHRTDRP